MFKPQNKIIIVDDVQYDLDRLSKAFYDNGIGCKTFKYDSFDSPKLENIRVAFFDININPSGGSSDSQICNSVATAIEQYISIQNGPFALIFWTSKPEMIEKIKIFIQRKTGDFPKPFLINHLSKDEVNAQNLPEKLSAILNDETLQLLFSFQEDVALAASKTIDQIYNIIPKDSKWGENQIFKKNYEQVFSKIAISTLGFEHAKENPEKAINEALLPIHNYILLNSIKNNAVWKSFLKSINKKSLKYPNTFEESKLNSIFHIEKTTGIHNEKEIRGSVIKIDKTSSRKLKIIGIKNLENWINKIIPFKTDKNPAVQKNIDQIKANIHSGLELVAVELSTACDYSQRKERINKYVLGIIVPKVDVKKFIDKESRAESSYHVGGCNFNHNGSEFQIWLNLNFVIGTTSNDKKLGNVQFVLKKEIMDMIGNKYASHVSRIGITSF